MVRTYCSCYICKCINGIIGNTREFMQLQKAQIYGWK